MTATINGVRLFYSDTGGDVPLLCLHGGMGIDGRTLRVPGILDLATFGVRVVIPDQRGHGASARGVDSEFTHAMWAGDARALAASLGLRTFALLGHSYGGFLALECAVRWPESLTHLILVGTSAGPVSAPFTPFGTDAELQAHFRAIWPRFFSGSNKYWSVFDSAQFSVGPYNAAFARELPAYDLRDRLSALHVPTLLVVGHDDPYLSHMMSLAERLPDAELCVLDGIGHLPFLEGAHEFTSTVRAFLHRHD